MSFNMIKEDKIFIKMPARVVTFTYFEKSCIIYLNSNISIVCLKNDFEHEMVNISVTTDFTCRNSYYMRNI